MTYERERWALLRDIFESALEQTASERQEFLRNACAGDELLQAEIESLLIENDEAGSFLMKPGWQVAESEHLSLSLVGKRVGAYKIVSEIGRGGMGAVFLAHRADEQYDKRVAIKVLQPHVGAQSFIRRFRTERQILASLNHPNIARLLDGGAAPDGCPYLVMDYVEGVPITDYCNQRQLSIPARLRLFRQVCQAVHYAHQNLVIHRDLKPGNILVTADGIPVLLDFGIAKVLNSDPSSDAPNLTKAETRLMTPEYASPEQVRADAVTTASDVYSLGIILFELITGTRPYRFPARSHAEIERIVCGHEVPVPSAVVTTEHGRKTGEVSLERTRRQLKGDLDNIVLMALRKEHSRRYSSVEQLSEDIRRHLDGLPVIARKDTLGYVGTKFLHRHKVGALATIAIFLALAAGLVARTSQAIRANRAERTALVQRDRALRAEAAAKSERDRALRAEVSANIERDKAIQEKQRADNEAETAKAISEFLQKDLLATASPDTQAMPNNRPDPDLKVRTALDRAAKQIERKFPKQPLVEASIRQTLGETYRDLGQYSEAQRELERATEMRERLLGENHPETLSSKSRLAAVYQLQGKLAQAESLFSKLVNIQLQVLGETHRETLFAMNQLALLYREQGRYPRAELLQRKVLAGERQIHGDNTPEVGELMNNLALVYSRQAKYAQAEDLYTKAIEIWQRTAGEEHPKTLMCMNNLANMYNSQGRYDAAERLNSQLLGVRLRVLGKEHLDVLYSMHNLAANYMNQGKYEQSGAMLAELQEIQRRVLGVDHPLTMTSLQVLGTLYRSEGKYEQAEQVFKSVLENRRRLLGVAHPETVRAEFSLALVYQRQGRHDQAVALILKALEAWRKTLGSGHPDTVSALVSLGRSRLDQHKYVEGESLLREALEIQEKTNFDTWLKYVNQSLLGAALIAQRRYAEAERLTRSGYEMLRQRENTIPAGSRWMVKDAGERIVQLYYAWGNPKRAKEWADKLQIGPN